MMHPPQRIRLLATGMMLAATALAGSARAQRPVVSDVPLSTLASVQDVALDGDTVTGSVVNRTSRELRDVRLLVRYTWLWNNERSPGGESPGRASFHVIPSIAPGATVRFTHRPEAPLPARTDGHFTASAEVVGLTEVGE